MAATPRRRRRRRQKPLIVVRSQLLLPPAIILVVFPYNSGNSTWPTWPGLGLPSGSAPPVPVQPSEKPLKEMRVLAEAEREDLVDGGLASTWPAISERLHCIRASEQCGRRHTEPKGVPILDEPNCQSYERGISLRISPHFPEDLPQFPLAELIENCSQCAVKSGDHKEGNFLRFVSKSVRTSAGTGTGDAQECVWGTGYSKGLVVSGTGRSQRQDEAFKRRRTMAADGASGANISLHKFPEERRRGCLPFGPGPHLVPAPTAPLFPSLCSPPTFPIALLPRLCLPPYNAS